MGNSEKGREIRRKQQFVADSKKICEEITGQNFAFITKVSLAIIVNNLIQELHKRAEDDKTTQESYEKLNEELTELKKKYHILNNAGGKGVTTENTDTIKKDGE